jgi:glycosyltransferase involved in cell wall biosynthesis
MKTKLQLSLVLPAYNEETILEKNIRIVSEYLESNQKIKDWEIIIVNDGSKDSTKEIAEKLGTEDCRIKVVNHVVNLNLGHALRTGFSNACGEFIIVLDLDLSYNVDHIEKIYDTLVATQADVVIASPYMKGGKVTAVPFLRAFLSRCVNRFMQFSAQEKYFTFTGMVRGYRSKFIRNLNLKTKDYEVNPEILYKAMILRARIVEIPAHLDWTEQNKFKGKRTSNMRIIKSVFSGLMSGFIFRPYIFFLGVGIILFLISLYIIIWIFINTLNVFPDIVANSNYFDDRFSMAVAAVFQKRPHSFFVGGFTLILSFIFFAIGFLSLQNKRYFEELFHLNTYIRRKVSKK